MCRCQVYINDPAACAVWKQNVLISASLGGMIIELLAKLSFFKKLLLGRKVKLLLYNVLTFLKVLANFKPYEF